MIVSFLLHLYQPPFQYARIFHELASECYVPLVRLLKRKKEFRATLNIPLSLLEWFDKEKVEGFTEEIALLRDKEVIELTGSAAYHPILTKLSEAEVERQIILNEAGLGYYLGRRQGFEGENAFMIKNLGGFFPPEMAFNSDLGKLVESLGYEWVILDEVSIPGDKREEVKSSGIFYRLLGSNLKICFRDRGLSLGVAYKRDSDPGDFIEGLKFLSSLGRKFALIVLDGETFGHHNKGGIDLLDNLLDSILAEGHTFSTLSNLMHEFDSKKETPVVEASWGASDEDMKEGNVYPKWYLSGNEVHSAFSDFESLMLSSLSKVSKEMGGKTSGDHIGNLPVWDFNKVSVSSDLSENEKSFIKSRILLDKALNSDKYWWSSKNPFFDVNLIKRSLELFVKSAEKISPLDQDILKDIKVLKERVLNSIK
ncbi:hypothetical protein A2716_01035 [candidate division WWE3 bacterium RIFCSPHIGHO2_01_FULL_40_23]|uniref:Glycoside hydrolase family 57 N-terminal domain-containing protein n=1 Tax=candidate division WWE3 bacterium RIFCSPLOWO2_01_FULL_41_18 TaxID=1802625 RepID=A0A1F4VFU6_UNCKA|nr:MAG: hypothetical protein A2716_01035 [candidate division WWE3 bacterium RIFCSPHIGHO2_01_FULL_40_23]OGC55573.1 MAG: hypothetical protein A3A78_01305 [candidate division WWE3 bacterium RIFCSPLOWO2_01_FULL_41_18]